MRDVRRLSIMILCLLLCMRTDAARAATPNAAFTSDGKDIKAVHDSNIRTSWKAPDAECTLRLSSDTPFDGVYIQWLTPPENLSVECVSGNRRAAFCPLDGGEKLNQYIRLPCASNDVILKDSVKLAVCEARVIRGEDAGVERWLPPAHKADILIFAAHPDDDLLYFGGTLPVYSGQRGLSVQTVFMTAPSRLRQDEALAGQWLAGGRYHPVFGEFPDRLTHTAEECARQWGRESTLEFIVEQLRRFKPDVVLSHDLNGEYGHGAHMLTAALLVEAVPLAEDAYAFPESAGRWGTHAVSKLYLHLYNEHTIRMDWSVALDAFDGKRAIDIAREAFQCHKSQQGYGMDVRDKGKYSSTAFGLCITRVGYDTVGGDFMENVPKADRASTPYH